MGVFEQDVPDYIAQSFPRLYSIGQENERFNTRVVTMWITMYLGIIDYFIRYYEWITFFQ